MQLGVNILDLERLDPILRQILFGGKLDADNLIMVGKEVILAFTCDMLTAAATVEGARMFDKKAERYPTRTYVKAAGKDWLKLSGTARLVMVEGNKCRLDPVTFPPEPVDPRTLAINSGPVQLGKR